MAIPPLGWALAAPMPEKVWSKGGIASIRLNVKGVPVIWARPSSFYGVGNSYLVGLLQGHFIRCASPNHDADSMM